MPRYFIELAYHGKAYAGFQKQQNANTIQCEMEKALRTYFRTNFELTGSSRTDAGVHAIQNFFHFDSELTKENFENTIYHLNAILPPDIVIKNIIQVKQNAHCRFDATFRRYQYNIYTHKDPFQQDTAFFFPYNYNKDILLNCAQELFKHQDFETFSKRNSQVFTYNCTIQKSSWHFGENKLIYTVQANRFLRGMVRAIVGTQLMVGFGKISLDDFENIILSKKRENAGMAAKANGLTLEEVNYPFEYFK